MTSPRKKGGAAKPRTAAKKATPAKKTTARKTTARKTPAKKTTAAKKPAPAAKKAAPKKRTAVKTPKVALPTQDEIRQRAHRMWLEAGSPIIGDAFGHWIAAEKQLLTERGL
jgi:DNA-binding protein HU-beta